MSELQSVLTEHLGQWAAEVARAFVQRRVAEGELLIAEGTSLTDEGLLLVLEGTVQVEAERPEDGFAFVKHAGPGQVLGVLGLLDHSPRSATCRAATEVHLAELPRGEFQRLYEDRTPLGLAFLSWLARQLVDDLRSLDTLLRQAATDEVESWHPGA